MSMPAGWYDDPFTDHLQRYWTGDSWTKETRPREDLMPEARPVTAAPPYAATSASGGPTVINWIVPSILAIIFCAWPLAIPGLIFAVKANSAQKQGNVAEANRQAGRARLFVLLSVALGVIVWAYLAFVIMTTDMPTDPGDSVTPFGS
jgi:hypothetical protein